MTKLIYKQIISYMLNYKRKNSFFLVITMKLFFFFWGEIGKCLIYNRKQ